MAIKLQYSVQLHPDTKCPSCNKGIKQVSSLLYVCDTGHVLEALVVVSMLPKPKQEPVKVNGPKEEVLTPDYDHKKVMQ